MLFGDFPYCGTFLVDKMADLQDRGVDVEIFALKKLVNEGTPRRYFEYKMEKWTHFLDYPNNFLLRILAAIPKFIHILFARPVILSRVLNFKKYGRNALSLKLLFWVEPFLGKKFDLMHCHFGPIANKFLIIRDILGLEQKFMTTFYGYDVSHIFKEKPANYYDRLKKECSLFIVMSQDMKERIIGQGFPAEKIEILPPGIDADSYTFKERKLNEGEPVKIVSVGRFVEKKGFDDLLKALAIVNEKSVRPFECEIIGDGPLRDEIHALAAELNVKKEIKFKGYMPIEDILKIFMDRHFFVQPSKTAKDGDME
ncbi:MAG: glycosyltransferase [Candidatus Portnoybacteria bacterium]|nr:glycosyltransferase [Candidatus Portnoybacteria bacterium]